MTSAKNTIRNYKLSVDTVGKALLVMLFCCGTAFGQSSETVERTPREAATNSQDELMIWLMGGTKASSLKKNTSDKSVRKVLIGQGVVPNRILRNSIMQKALNYGSALS